ncbi:MFS transporter [Galbitalea sp. SE-J8]|uniref:MFS transporter n=1 Tax=Galbitalea sp. SE-J8 TaxID=3054952 RepID=UPI00259CD2F1|nr:MFS transporter [Galbitalea sp. SE-J8]MDM4762388.1 MFS transporter [Galbitalea sp. SE-J8]
MTSSPLRRPAYRRLLAARTAIVVGNAIAPVALAFAVLDLTGSAAALGLVVASRSIANVAVLLVGGVIADRLPRQLVLLVASVGATLTQTAVVAVLVSGRGSVGALAALAALNGVAAGIALPASSALIPTTVPSYLLRQANAILRLAVNTGTIVGTAAGSVLIAALGPATGIAVDAATFLVGGLLFGAVHGRARSMPSKDAPAPSSVLHDIRVGWREFAGRRWVWVIVAQFGIENAAFAGAVAILGPVIADQSFGRAAWGVILATQTVGYLAGGALALRWRPRRALAVGVALSATTALPVFALAVAPVVPLLIAAFFLGGLAVEQFTVAWDQALQTHIPADRLARVYSYDALGSFAAMPIGEALIGPVATTVSTPIALLACGAAIVLATAAAMTQRSIRSLAT